MIEYNDELWWNAEKLKKAQKEKERHIIDSDYFQQELAKIEEALQNLSHLIKKYANENKELNV
jgi:DNA repair ATPase RecN